MSLSPFTPEPPAERAARYGGGAAAVGALALFLLYGLSQPLVVERAEQWVEVVVQQVQPPEPPKPEPPKPEPPKPEPPKKKQAVKFEEMKTKPPPDQPPPPAEPPPKPVRRVQGLSASSFAPGAGTGLSVNAGNSLDVKANGERMTLEEAQGPLAPRPYTAVSKLPKLKSAPPLEVPEAAKEAQIEGTITVKLDLDEQGRVTKVVVLRGLGMGLDEACAAAWRASRWEPGQQDGAAVPVQGVPQACKVVQTQ